MRPAIGYAPPMRHACACVILALALASFVGCSPPPVAPSDDQQDDQPSAPTPLVEHFYLQVDPINARAHIYAVSVSAAAADPASSALTYVYGDASAPFDNCSSPSRGTCLPAVGHLNLWTDQNKVTYVDAGGTCYSNGTTGGAGCVGLVGTCAQLNMFCAPIQAISNYAFALPDPVLQVSGPAANFTSCVGGASFGQCSGDAANAHKVDGPTSDLASPTAGCSYCFANSSLVGTNLGLRDALLPGYDATLAALDTVTMAMSLSSSAGFRVNITVSSAAPTLDTPAIALLNPTEATPPGPSAVCITPGATSLTVSGTAFGPPAACSAASCPSTGAPGAGYALQLAGGVAPLRPTWSDTLLGGATPPFSTAAMAGGAATVTTPIATRATETYALCARYFDVHVRRGGSDFLPGANGIVTTPMNTNFKLVVTARRGSTNAQLRYTGTVTCKLVGCADGASVGFPASLPFSNTAQHVSGNVRYGTACGALGYQRVRCTDAATGVLGDVLLHP